MKNLVKKLKFLLFQISMNAKSERKRRNQPKRSLHIGHTGDFLRILMTQATVETVVEVNNAKRRGIYVKFC